MAINTYLSTTESDKSKINKQAEQKRTHRYGEHINGCQMGGGFGEWAKMVKGLTSTNWFLQNTDGDVKYSIDNVVNSLITT